MTQANGVELIELDNGQLFHIKLTSHHMDTYRTFYDHVDKLEGHHTQTTPDKTFRMLIDFSQNFTSALTPGIRKMSLDVARKHPDIRGKIALLTPKTPLAVVMMPMHSFIEREAKRDQPYLAFKVFSDLDKSLAWLRQTEAE